MKFLLSLYSAVVCIALFANSNLASAEEYLHAIPTDPLSRVSIKIHGPFNTTPTWGAFPFQVEILNRSTHTYTWHLEVTARSNNAWDALPLTVERNLTVQAGGEMTFEIEVPLIFHSANLSAGYSTVWVSGQIYGPGVESGNFSVNSASLSTSTAGQVAPPFTVVSRNYLKQINEFAEHLKTKKLFFNGEESANFTLLPTHWRGLMGVGGLWIALEEWMVLSEPQRLAIKDWVLLGGRFYLVTSAFQSLEIPQFGLFSLADGEEANFGYGKIIFIIQERNALDAKWFTKTISDTTGNNTAAALKALEPTAIWNFANDILPVSTGTGIIILLMLLYAVVVGPINVYRFARREKRLRLYWTTPLIATVASALLITIIIFQDGTGGTGKRFVAVFLSAQSHSAVITQEQVARSGLIMGRTFTPSEEVFMQRVSYNEKKRVPATYRKGTGSYVISDGTYSGEWFGSRSLQAHILQTVIPTRARVEIIHSTKSDTGVEATAPVLLSSIDTVLKEFYYVAPEGIYWHAANVRPGEKRVLERSEHNQFQSWKAKSLGKAGTVNYTLAQEPFNRSNYFFATTTGHSDFVVETLPSIKWEEDEYLLYGPVTSQREEEAL